MAHTKEQFEQMADLMRSGFGIGPVREKVPRMIIAPEPEKPTQPIKDDSQIWVCATCGSEDVQHAMWVRLNTNEIREEFGTWNEDDSTWCDVCALGDGDGDGHTKVITKSAYQARRHV